MKLTDLRKYRIVVISLGTLIFFFIFLLALFAVRQNQTPSETVVQEQDPAKIEDMKAALPYVEPEYRLSYSYDSDLFIVTYPGYKTVDEMEVKTVAWLKEYTAYSNVQVKYGEVGGEVRGYDLLKDMNELLKDNTYIKYDTSNEYGTS